MKRIVAIMLSLALGAAFLTGCGSSNNEEETTKKRLPLLLKLMMQRQQVQRKPKQVTQRLRHLLLQQVQ